MKTLRTEVTQHYAMASPSRDDIISAIAKLRELIEILEEEGILGLELPLCIAEKARLQGALGDEEGRQITHRRALIARRLCVGFDHPSCR
ncbi:hypothetical protein PG990_006759 [Apiospora arundinis]|uniref:Uncharacterized protein n=1 Tax=Apiospora arundinis TaxID=335852 RepID=A0ABR2JCA7_9PEZI